MTKFNLNLKTLAMAVALSIGASAANAAIVLPSSGDGELVLTAWDAVRSVSYSRQLEVNLSAFTNTTQNFAGDALFTSTFGTSSPDNIQWNVVAADNVVAPGTTQGTPGQHRVLTTSTASTAAGMSLTNAGMSTATGKVNTFFGNVNAMGCDVNASCATADPTDLGYGGSNSAWGERFGGLGNMNNAGTGFNNNMFFYYMTGATGSIATQATKVIFQEGGAPSLWSLASNGSLSYTAVPVPAAVWLLGSGLLGLIGIARRPRQAVALA